MNHEHRYGGYGELRLTLNDILSYINYDILWYLTDILTI